MLIGFNIKAEALFCADDEQFNLLYQSALKTEREGKARIVKESKGRV
jgi:hypothetical protein